MKDEFVTYEQAVSLKGLGFDEECLGGYSKKFPYENEWKLYIGDIYCEIKAPLKQQVFRWFREKYGFAAQFAYYHVPKWTYEILEFTDIKLTPNKLVVEYSKPRTCKEAENACIDKLIELAKQQNNGK